MPTPTNDIEYVNHGSIITMTPLSAEAQDWCAEHIASDETIMVAGSYAIEPRYFGEIAYGAQEDGLTSNVRVEVAS